MKKKDWEIDLIAHEVRTALARRSAQIYADILCEKQMTPEEKDTFGMIGLLSLDCINKAKKESKGHHEYTVIAVNMLWKESVNPYWKNEFQMAAKATSIGQLAMGHLLCIINKLNSLKM